MRHPGGLADREVGAVVSDVVVVGAGSAGCLLAARLTAEGDRSVVLIEAGPDYPSVADLPADIADGSGPTLSHDWHFTAEPDGTGNRSRCPGVA
jgi:choline dehydrogenase